MGIKKHRELVTFDWALKRLLRSKANCKALTGLSEDQAKKIFAG